jgi:hypothetical protein
MTRRSKKAASWLALFIVPVLAVGLIAAGCGKAAVKSGSEASSSNNDQGITDNQSTNEQSQQSSATNQESPVAPEDNPPGDIPDNQLFVTYSPAGGGFQVKVPEGWAQSTSDSGSAFTDKLNNVSIAWVSGAPELTLQRAQSIEVQELSNSEPAFQLVGTKQVSLPGGQAILISYQKNSAPNEVTGKKYRMDVLRYEFYRNGLQVNLTLESPVGADNVDPWNIISGSFKWL